MIMSTVSKLAEFMESIEEIVTTISEYYQFEVFTFTIPIYVPANSIAEFYFEKPKDGSYWIIVGVSAYSTLSCFQLDVWADNLLIIHDPCFQPHLYEFESFFARGILITGKYKIIMRVVNPNSQGFLLKALEYIFKIPESLYYKLQQKYYKALEDFVKS
jgi:hypothetical protein